MITLSTFAMAIRLVAALLLGGLLGVERTMAGKMAGLRTYALVSMGSALFVIIAQQVTALSVFNGNADPLRVASQVLVGIGFIGAGLVMVKDSKLTGLTTAAGLWLAAGVGLACGYGLISLAIISTMLGLLVLVSWFLEKPLLKNDIDDTYEPTGSK
ncbi:MAG: MgtC/SapB family protein [Candidatus Paceibacterota bacterium]|jgi:putative Mg2+ transporter-C (MgtC) family protein